MLPGVVDGKGQRVIACLLVVDCGATRVELGLVVVLSVIAALVAAKLGDVVLRIFVEEICAGGQSCDDFARCLSRDLVRPADESYQVFLRDLEALHGLWTVSPAVVILKAMLMDFGMHKNAPKCNYLLVAVVRWVGKPNLRVTQHQNGGLVVLSGVLAANLAAADCTCEKWERSATLIEPPPQINLRDVGDVHASVGCVFRQVQHRPQEIEAACVVAKHFP